MQGKHCKFRCIYIIGHICQYGAHDLNLGLRAQRQDVIHPKLITTHMIGDGGQQEDINACEGHKVARK